MSVEIFENPAGGIDVEVDGRFVGRITSPFGVVPAGDKFFFFRLPDGGKILMEICKPFNWKFWRR